MSLSVWNRLQTAANTTTTNLIQTPADLLPQNKQRRHQRRATETGHEQQHVDDPDKRFWQETFDQRLDGLEAPTNAPYRYEVRRGKAVPSPSDTPLGSRDYLPSLETTDYIPNTAPRDPPPRRRFRSDSGCDKDACGHDCKLAIDTDTDITMHARGPRRRMTDVQGVSPPSSPDGTGHLDHDVSPIDNDAGMSQQRLLKGSRPTQESRQPTSGHPAQPRGAPPQAHSRQSSGQNQKSSIPTMRRERRRQQSSSVPRPNAQEAGRQTPPVGANQNSVGREESVDQRGRPVQETSHDDAQMYGMTTTITSSFARQSKNPSPSLGQRMRQFGRGSKPEPVDSRPAWNGASGRQAVVSPVQNDTTVAPLSIPPRSNKRVGKDNPARGKTVPQSNRSTSETIKASSATTAVRKFIPSEHGLTPEPHGRSSPVTDPATRKAETPVQSYPSLQQTASPVVGTQVTDFQTQHNTPVPSRLTIPDPDKAIKRKPPPSSQTVTPSHAVHPSTSSSVYSAQAGAPKNQVSDDEWVQPPSRFSFTTFATSNADSPRQSADEDRPPLPEPPQTQSVMDRRRPLRGQESPQASDDHVVISLKSASVSNHIGLGIDKHNTPRVVTNAKDGRPSSIMSTSKELPPAPPEMIETKDRVVLLSAKIAGLAHRRNNITKSIKQMTELMPAGKLMESTEILRKREDEKKKVENLKAELAEIQQQEYDLGLKLHRAYKRQERDANYESGTLWVRRVTS